MDDNHLEKWFENVMPKLKLKSIIVTDNAPIPFCEGAENSLKFMERKEKVSVQNWVNCIKPVTEKEMWEIDGLVENQNLIISVNSDSSDSELLSTDEL
ncbi:hypothetical protein NPIL_633481 [Nephila pilipes]|uniref:Uncharacterized protein n=1 Tax=Nephila pilipes TaxID=299642 RepID=A0A8X6K263_NEPPI|nr:hypothetical protein NPIL_633481 [Nephila pilipes]